MPLDSAGTKENPAKMKTPRRANGEAVNQGTAVVKPRSKDTRLAFEVVASAALSTVDSVLSNWLPDGKRQGSEWTARNPTRNDGKPGSFSVNMTTGKWSDFATSDRGGDLVSLVAYLDGTNQGAAADTLADFLGLSRVRSDVQEPGLTGQPGQAVRARVCAAPEADPVAGTTGARVDEIVTPVPEGAPPPPQAHRKRGTPSAIWPYFNAAGRVLFYVCRFDTPKGKDVIPLSLWRTAGVLRWQWKGHPASRPLYGLDRLALRPEAPVLVVEGEKAADAAAELLPDFVVVTSPNGAKAAGKTDWQPLAGRLVLIWADADEAGDGYAADVDRLAGKAGAHCVGCLDLAALAGLRGSPLPSGFDASDALNEGLLQETLESIALAAIEITDAGPDLMDETPPNEADANHEQTTSTPEPARQPRFEVIVGVKGRRPGVYEHGVDSGRARIGEGPTRSVWICSPLYVRASTRDEHGKDWGRLIEWKDRDGRIHTWSMPCEFLAGTGDELRAVLLRGGLDITTVTNDRRRLLDYLSSARPQVMARAVTRTGWHGRAFVLPDQTMGDSTAEPIHYQAMSVEAVHLGRGGNLQGWRERVAAPSAGNSRMVLALSAAFAAPLLGLLDAEGGGIHLRGNSSTGKSTALMAAASVWGPPAYVRSWRATDNALEGVAALHSDLLLCLDEIGELPSKTAGAVAYMLANGSGKGRARVDGSARAVARWRLLFLSTGEIGLADLIAEGGGRARAGQEVRVIDLPADGGAGHGMFERLPDNQTAGAFADAVRDAAATEYGHAGPAFVVQLVEHYTEARQSLREARDNIANVLAPPESDGQVRRVAQRFALIAAAGELATEWGLTGWPDGEAEHAAERCFRAWLASRGTAGAAEPAAILAQLRRFLEAHGESRFAPWDEDPNHRPTINRAGFRKATADGTGYEYFILSETFKSEICAGFDHRSAAKILVQRGMLMTESDGGATRKERLPGMGNTRCYRLLPNVWDTDHA